MLMRTLRTALGFVILAVFLTACGGGGGGGGGGGVVGGTADPTLAFFAGNLGGPGSADGTGALASFNFPSGVATDSGGNVYVADSNNHTIRTITPAGAVTTLAGVAGLQGFQPGSLPGRLTAPRAVAVSGSSLYVVFNNGVAVVRNLP